MKCPYCGQADTRVLDSRTTDEGESVRRRRECTSCNKRFTTYERVDKLPLIVIKKDSRREAFDRNKVLLGLIKACEKRSIPLSELEKLVDEIEQELVGEYREVSSAVIGEAVMERLRKLDQVAYVRFASVYRQFKDINRFMEELQQLLDGGSA
ncbi:MAG: transcriptional repressor NrdR [Firmicutes bacterium]|nr:transcriptional repressor NrdR [Bacillota bacterium]